MVNQPQKTTSHSSNETTIGLFDSGVGGLSILHALHHLIPEQPLLFIADQAHVPYGPRPVDEVRQFSESITDFLLSQGAEIIVVACNTASAAALKTLRQKYPHIPFVGMEPAVKPAAEQTHSGVVGVLATPATFQGALYTSVVERFASHVTLMQNTCQGLVEQIEAGDLLGSQTRQILQNALTPMLAAGIDTVVLGCTHYPFAIPLIQEIVGDQVRVINPAEAVARQTKRLLDQYGQPASSGQTAIPQIFTTASAENLHQLSTRLMNIDLPVRPLCWNSTSPAILSFCENRLS